MIRSSLVKSACVAIALSGFSPPQAGAIEMQGSNPTPMLNDGIISKAYFRPPRRDRCWSPRRRLSSWRNLSRRLRLSRRGLSRRLRLSRRRVPRLGATRLVSLGPRRRDRCRRRHRRARRRGRSSLRGRSAGAGPLLVLHRSELPRRLLGRLLGARGAWRSGVAARPAAIPDRRRTSPWLANAAPANPAPAQILVHFSQQ